MQARAIGAAQVGAAQVGATGAAQVGAGAQHEGAGAQLLQLLQEDLQQRGLQHFGRLILQQRGLQQLLLQLLQLLTGAQHDGATGAQQLGAAAGAQHVLAGAQQLESAIAWVALAQQNSTAAVRVVHFIMGISWKGVCRRATEANPGNPSPTCFLPFGCTAQDHRLTCLRGIDSSYFRLPSP